MIAPRFSLRHDLEKVPVPAPRTCRPLVPRFILMLFAGLLYAPFAATLQALDNRPEWFEFHMPNTVRYRVEGADTARATTPSSAPWLTATQQGTTNKIQLGARIAVQTVPGTDLQTLIDPTVVTVARVLNPDWYVLQASDAHSAVAEAGRLAGLKEIRISYPIMRRALRLHDTYAARPDDPYFDWQWNVENRTAEGPSLGVDLNLRAAWNYTRGEGVTLAVVDDGIELGHPEFAAREASHLQFNFATGTPDGLPVLSSDNHGTAVAGLAAADWRNGRGMAGAAPAVALASWKIFSGFSLAASDEQLMDMFQYQTDTIDVQNHSWGNSGIEQLAPTPMESIGLSNAIHLGRQGRGVIMVRSGGNGRVQMSDANDDGYASDPRAVTVAAVRRDGRSASYSTPGACLLVAAPGGDADANLFTTDRGGSAGFNFGSYSDDYADYVFSSAVQGTSFSAPQISGLAALLLSANPELTYRDVQLILALSARHFDDSDPDVSLNGAGLKVSHNVGFGIPNAGYAVELARKWLNRPPLVESRLAASLSLAIPDDGLRLTITGTNPVPSNIATIPGTPSLGAYADTPTGQLPVVDIGLAGPPVTANLTGKAALIQRGTHLFIEKIENAANAGAALAIIYNNVGTSDRLVMAETEFAPIPALFIGLEPGEALRDQLQLEPDLKAELATVPASHTFVNTDTNHLVCEHVGLRVTTTHNRRGDLRITLVSPAGTRSIMQRINNDSSSGPFNWTYYSVHHFLESSRGSWQVEITDQQPLDSGTVTELELILRGVPITDTDGDGLDDPWEQAHFDSLDQGPRGDPDADGQSNALEQVLGTDPTVNDRPLQTDFSIWNNGSFRLSWPGVQGASYQILGISESGATPNLLFDVPGEFPITERFISLPEAGQQFFRVSALAPGTIDHSAPAAFKVLGPTSRP